MAKKSAGKVAQPSRLPRAGGTPALRSSSLLDTRVVYCGDNLEQLAKLPDACVDLIYIDPPFNSNRNYEVFWGETKEKRAFADRHESTRAYIDYLRPRCVQLARVLKKTGSFYYHCDWHASHYVKVMLDQILGENNFHTEIIRKRTSTKSHAYHSYPNNHDSIFFYTGSDEYTFNREFLPLGEEYVESFYKYKDENGRRYRLTDMRNPSYRPNLIYDYKGYKPHPNGWAVSLERMKELDAEGRLYLPKDPNGRIARKCFLEEQPGIPIDSIWGDIP